MLCGSIYRVTALRNIRIWGILSINFILAKNFQIFRWVILPKTTVHNLSMAQPQRTKQQKLAALVKKKKQCDKIAHDIVLRLIEEKVEKVYLLEKAGLICPRHYDDVIEERKLSKLCGWVLCDNEVTEIPKQQYIIRSKKVLDISERKNFCTPRCYAASCHFKDQLLDTPLWLRHQDPTPEFKLLEDDDEAETELHGVIVKLQSITVDDLPDET